MKVIITTNLIIVILILFGVIGWFMNVSKLIQCDFEAPYKAEVIHSIGIIPVVGGIVGWMDFGK